MTAHTMIVGAGCFLLTEAVKSDGKVDGPADAKDDHEPVDEAKHVIHEAAMFRGVRGLTDKFIDPGEVHSEEGKKGVSDSRVHAGVFTLAADHGKDDASGTGEHEGEEAEHDENGESLSLTDEATLVSHAGGTGENGGRHGNHGQMMMVRIFLTRYHTP
jgi:hypothetical protein